MSGRMRTGPTMNPEYWKHVQELFLEAVDLPPREQAAFLATACASDLELRREVESLLESDARQPCELEAAVEDLAQSVLSDGAAGDLRLGPWRLGRKLGKGGMGTVYLATRDDRLYEQQAAIKLVNPGMDTVGMLARFRHERQILAGLDHPYIARLIDGGSAPDGRPYLVMEYVEGEAIGDYCRNLGLNVRQRCELFLKVCEAVSYAHRSLVVHRDLKPGNIFITGEGVPKLLDFGVAKLVESDRDTSFTSMHGDRMLTPDYASPEQVRALPVTTATDVYSLGAILFELLTGLKAHRLTDSTPSEMERAICETEMSRPSAVAVHGPVVVRGWARQLVGDLDNIILMAMRKEPERRYASVERFAADIRRYLDGHPVEARGAGFGYRAKKFARRNWLAVAAAAAVFASLSLGIVLTAVEARRANAAQAAAMAESLRARQERDRAIQAESAAEQERNRAVTAEQTAQKERKAAEAVTNFVRNDVIGRANPNNRSSADPTLRAALDAAASNIEGKFKGQPEVETRIRMTIAESYFGLSRYPEARQQWEHALAVVAAWHGLRNEDAVDCLVSIGAAYRREGKLSEAEAQYRKALEIGLPLLGEKNKNILTALGNLATVYRYQGKLAESEALNSRVLRIQKEVLGPEDLETLVTMSNLASNYVSRGEFNRAVQLYREVLDIRRRVQGSEHLNTVGAMARLASAQLTTNPIEANSLLTQALALQQTSLGEAHDDTLSTIALLSTLRMFQGQLAEAQILAAKAADLRTKSFGPRHAQTLRVRLLLAEVVLRQGNYRDAEVQFRDLLRDFETAGEEGWERYAASLMLGASLAGEQRHAEASGMIARSREALQQRRASIPALYRYYLDSPPWLAEFTSAK